MKKIRKRLNAGTIPANKEYAAGTVPENKEYSAGSLSYVCRCWLAMPLGAGFLSWVLACHTIKRRKKEVKFAPFLPRERLFCTPPPTQLHAPPNPTMLLKLLYLIVTLL